MSFFTKICHDTTSLKHSCYFLCLGIVSSCLIHYVAASSWLLFNSVLVVPSEVNLNMQNEKHDGVEHESSVADISIVVVVIRFVQQSWTTTFWFSGKFLFLFQFLNMCVDTRWNKSCLQVHVWKCQSWLLQSLEIAQRMLFNNHNKVWKK